MLFVRLDTRNVLNCCRHGVGAYSRLSRVNTKESMFYKDMEIPKGVRCCFDILLTM